MHELTSKMVWLILNVETVVFVRMFCETLQIRYQPFFVVHNFVNSIQFIHTTHTTMTTMVESLWDCGGFSANRDTGTDVDVIDFPLRAQTRTQRHSGNGNKMVDISTYSDIRNTNPLVIRLLGCDRYHWQRINFDQFSSVQRKHADGWWLWHSLLAIKLNGAATKLFHWGHIANCLRNGNVYFMR